MYNTICWRVLQFVARNVEQCDAASDDKSDAVDDKTTTTKTTTSL